MPGEKKLKGVMQTESALCRATSLTQMPEREADKKSGADHYALLKP
jgi:hypothetical protein